MGKIHSDTNRSSLHENMRKKKKVLDTPTKQLAVGLA